MKSSSFGERPAYRKGTAVNMQRSVVAINKIEVIFRNLYEKNESGTPVTSRIPKLRNKAFIRNLLTRV